MEDRKNVSDHLKYRKADYYKTVYSILHEHIEKSPEHFKAYILSLLGDNDYDKIVESVSKVDRALEKGVTLPGTSASESTPPLFPRGPPSFTPTPPLPSGSFPHPPPYVGSPPQHSYYPPTSSRRSRGLGIPTCFFCGIKGHISRDCYRRRRQLDKNGKP